VPHFQGTPLAHYHTQLRWCLPTEALALDLAPADIPLLHAFIAQRPTLSVR
jgi:(d)CTP diphosphatase